MLDKTVRNVARRGFTLIELLIVIAILLAIGGLVVVNLLPAKDQADIDLTQTQIDQFDNALSMFKLHMGRFPTDEEGLAALWNRDALEDEEEASNWKGSYLENPSPRDRWGSEWIYREEGEIRGEAFYDIISLGPDKEEDTDDDITNHDRFMDEEGEIAEEFEEFTPGGGDDGDMSGGDS
ncbi:MAG: type II secretion system major pseudopilin GspG [Planctomycetota bacterium]|nr:type II secretion system major pseudopilin GspG [Planctomycetota bacterium]